MSQAIGTKAKGDANESASATAVADSSDCVFPKDYETKRVIVYLIRHGEREDEVETSFRRDRTLKERVDPALTEEGYRQAAAAFQRLTNPEQRDDDDDAAAATTRSALLFASPLRRTIGTAMMVAKSRGGFRFPPPTSSSESHLFHITVLNGLCDCAAAVGRLGGTAQAVSNGFIDCASVSHNHNGNTHTSTMIPSLQNLKQSAFRAVSASDSASASETTVGDPPKSTHVRFWAEVRRQEGTRHQREEAISFLPMTPPFDPTDTSDIAPEMTPTTTASPLRKAGKAVGNALAKCVPGGSDDSQQGVAEDSFLAAADRAVLHCLRSGIDTCVLVTHREGIRDLAQDVCRHFPNPKSPSRRKSRIDTPYCCIGTFVATVHLPRQQQQQDLCFTAGAERDRRIQWTFLDVCPYESFSPLDRIPLPPPPPPAAGERTVHAVWTRETKQPQHFAVLSLCPNQGDHPANAHQEASSSCWETLCFSSFVREEFRESEWSRRYKFYIWDGRKVFQELVREMQQREKMLYGECQPSGKALLMRVEDQDETPPCPSEYVHVRVQNSL